MPIDAGELRVEDVPVGDSRPGLEVEDLLRKVLTDFGIMSGIDAPAAGPISDVTRHQFVSTLQQFLASLIPLQAHAVIMIDEAQGLSPRVLEEIRLLSNFETDQAKLLQIVLVGQPELDDLLRRPYMQQINQRVARRCELQPLSESEVGDYIERRLAVAASPSALAGPGGDVSAVSPAVARFSPAAVAAVARISGGIPRLVNTLCDRALDTAYERKMRTIEPGAVTESSRAAATRYARCDESAHQAAQSAIGCGGRCGGAPCRRRMVVDERWGASRAVDRTAADDGKSLRCGTRFGQRAPQPPRRQVAAGARESPGRSPWCPIPSRPASTPRPSAAAPIAAHQRRRLVAPCPAHRQRRAAFQIAVAAFKTEPRAQTVVDALGGMQIAATVRLDPTGSWYRVIAGPFTSREAAQTAQDTLTRNGYIDTLISPLTSDPR